MRCLNCNTLVADTDPCCLSCGARCTTPVRMQESGRPIPYIALAFFAVAWPLGYAQAYLSGESRVFAIYDRAAWKERTFQANVWGLGGAVLGFFGDMLIWSRRRRNDLAEPQPAPARAAVYKQQTASPARPARGYRGVIRVIAGIGWAVLFFFGAVMITAMIAVSRAGTDPEQKQAADEIGQRLMPWFFFGSIALAVILTKLRLLPGTRAKPSSA